MNMKDVFTERSRGLQKLIAYDDKYALYGNPDDPTCLVTVRRDKKPLTRKDRRFCEGLIEFLLTPTPNDESFH